MARSPKTKTEAMPAAPKAPARGKAAATAKQAPAKQAAKPVGKPLKAKPALKPVAASAPAPETPSIASVLLRKSARRH